jgi:hypothetical protein
MSQSEITRKTTEVFVDGKVVKRWDIVQQLKTSPYWRSFGLVYLGAALASFACATYWDGVDALSEFRRKNPDATREDEWRAARNGCTKHMWGNAWDAIVIPFSLISRIFPALVMLTNPRSN